MTTARLFAKTCKFKSHVSHLIHFIPTIVMRITLTFSCCRLLRRFLSSAIQRQRCTSRHRQIPKWYHLWYSLVELKSLTWKWEKKKKINNNDNKRGDNVNGVRVKDLCFFPRVKTRRSYNILGNTSPMNYENCSSWKWKQQKPLQINSPAQIPSTIIHILRFSLFTLHCIQPKWDA